MSNETRIRDVWARADKAKAREIQAHERAVWLHEAAAARFDERGDQAAAAAELGRARAAWRRLDAARREEAAMPAARALFLH